MPALKMNCCLLSVKFTLYIEHKQEQQQNIMSAKASINQCLYDFFFNLHTFFDIKVVI